MTVRMECQPCRQGYPVEYITDHMRRHHPDLDAQPDWWPDGGVVWHDTTLDPEDFPP